MREAFAINLISLIVIFIIRPIDQFVNRLSPCE